jgi:predicted RND superfamily exporter protein
MLNRWVLHIYDFLAVHSRWRWTLLLLAVLLPALTALRLRPQEDIADFLPMDEQTKQQLDRFKEQNNADRIVVLFSLADTSQINPDRLCDAIDAFSESVSYPIQTEVDFADLQQRVSSAYRQVPASFTPADTLRLDSLLTPENIASAVANRRAQLQLPLAGTVATAITCDPLNLFPEVPQVLSQSQFSSYQGYMFSADNRLAFAFLNTPYGSSESRRNARFIDSLQTSVNTLRASFPDMDIRLNGAPVIAVGNARQIKQDSLIAVLIALVLIIILLLRSLKSWRSMLLIVAATGYGLLFALGIMGLVHPRMSLIVIGIASVIIGIAVNYPLHVLVHRQYTTTVRQTLAEVISPLIVGNITTVGAFLTLVPLRSVALRDLGIFCACMLVGTILFSVLFLPHFRFETPRFDTFSRTSGLLHKTSQWHPENNRWLVAVVIVLTLVFAWFGRFTAFDSDLSHINFMTPKQRADIETINRLVGETTIPATENGVQTWNEYWSAHRQQVLDNLRQAAADNGFRQTAFAPFEELIQTPADEQMSIVNYQLSTINSQLSMSFNYIGTACSLVVFIFLWLSFRRLKYAIIAFLPMLVAWAWILGIMYLTGIQFNIVNIILATFIFGQGDDYTIFITEGLISNSEAARHPAAKLSDDRLLQYKNSIILSALIMFIGIGALIVARHPALHSLATVTIVGMFCVVLMAYLIPPLLFKIWKK